MSTPTTPPPADPSLRRDRVAVLAAVRKFRETVEKV